jgi:hypothetical protein
MRTADRILTLLAAAAYPKTDANAPVYINPMALTDEPMRLHARTDNADPPRHCERLENAAPQAVARLTDREDPSSSRSSRLALSLTRTQPKTLAELPIRNAARTLRHDAIRKKFRPLAELPSAMKSQTERHDPHSALQRILMLLPVETKLKTDAMQAAERSLRTLTALDR